MIDLNFHVLNHVIKLPVLYFKDIYSTYLNQRINADSNTVISFVYEEIQIDEIDTIELSNVSFSYDGYKNIIDRFNYKFQRGKIYCIVGKNGTGKSTPINLILGIFNDYYTGEILYNSIEIKKLDMYYIRKKIIGISEQEPKLINDSIFNNITYGVEMYNCEEIKDLLEKLNFLIQAVKKDRIVLIITHNKEFLNIADDVLDLNMNKSKDPIYNDIN